MPLAISNILWTTEQEPEAWATARDAGAEGIEVAPTRIAAWDALDASTLQAYRARLEATGLRIPSLQALLYGRTDVALLADFPSYQRLTDHLQRVADMAVLLGATRLVFGAPKQRLRGTLTVPDAMALATERLRPIAAAYAERGIALVLEPVPPLYGADFIHTTMEAAALVRAVNHPGLRLHLDTGAALIADEDPVALLAAHADILAHVHLSRPQLAPLATALPFDHALAAALASIPYQGWLSIEIGTQPTPLPIITQALTVAREYYKPTK